MSAPDKLISVIASGRGLARLNRYRVLLPLIYVNNNPFYLDILCRSVSKPGKQMGLFDRQTNQKIVKTPGSYVTDSITMNFTETNDYQVSRYFTSWMNSILNSSNYLLSYKSEYARDIVILAQDVNNKPLRGVILKKAFPYTFQKIDYSDKNQNGVVDIVIQFEYEDYEEFDISIPGLINTVINSIPPIK